VAKILIFGYYGYGNFGDELLLATLKAHLKEHELVIVSGDPVNTEKLHEIKAISRKMFWQRPGQHDLFLLGGGSLLQNSTSNRSLVYYLAAIERAKLAGMDVYLMAQGLGPLKGWWPKIAIPRVLKQTPLTVRDRQSLEIARGLKLKADLVADLALSYENYPQKKSNQFIGVAPKKGFINKANINWLLSFEREIRLFAFHRQDHELCFKLEKLLPRAHSVLLEKPSDLEQMAELDFLWGMRLHSLIIAVAMGIPALGISYDPKVAAFCQEANLCWHQIDQLPQKEWIRSGGKQELTSRAKKNWQLFDKYIKTSTSGHSY